MQNFVCGGNGFKSCRRGNGCKGPVCMQYSGARQRVLAWLLQAWLAMTVFTVLPSVCTHCWHPFSSLLQNCRRARKLKQDLQISGDLCNYVMLKGQWSFEAQCSLPCLKTLTAASAYQADQSIIVCWTKIHQTSWHSDQITFGAIGPKLLYHSPCAFSKSAGMYKL